MGTTSYIIDNVFHDCKSSFLVGTIPHSPVILSVLDQNILRHEKYSIANSAEDKLQILETPVLACLRGCQTDKPLNEVEPSALSPLNSTFAWIGTTSLRLRAEIHKLCSTPPTNCALESS